MGGLGSQGSRPLSSYLSDSLSRMGGLVIDHIPDIREDPIEE